MNAELPELNVGQRPCVHLAQGIALGTMGDALPLSAQRANRSPDCELLVRWTEFASIP
jgi:hypothetical protein